MLITKGYGKDFQCIGLLEVLWKDTTGIIKQRLTAAIKYHNSLHILRTGCETGTSNLDAKMIHKMKAMRELVLNTI